MKVQQVRLSRKKEFLRDVSVVPSWASVMFTRSYTAATLHFLLLPPPSSFSVWWNQAGMRGTAFPDRSSNIDLRGDGWLQRLQRNLRSFCTRNNSLATLFVSRNIARLEFKLSHHKYLNSRTCWCVAFKVIDRLLEILRRFNLYSSNITIISHWIECKCELKF